MATVSRLVGVYDADGSLRGEVTYWIKARLGGAHCALCDITHSAVGERSEWKSCRPSLPVPVETVHRDEVPDAVAAIGVDPPYVAAETDQGARLLLDAAALEACAGSAVNLIAALKKAAADAGVELGLTSPAADPGH